MKKIVLSAIQQLGFKSAYSGKEKTMYVIGKGCKAAVATLKAQFGGSVDFEFVGHVHAK